MSADPRSVLIVEDDPDQAEVFSRLLANRGVCVSIAMTLAQAEQQIAGQRFDAAVLDLNLPNGRGLETVRTFARIPGRPPFIVLTGCAAEDVACGAISEGAQDYLLKHAVSGEVLCSVIRRAMLRAQSHRRGALDDSTVRLLAEVQRKTRQATEATQTLNEELLKRFPRGG